uniref:Macaca fascicularis brain cDNA clone: QflA-23993, similar to human chromodomain helicase DNA binding protein 6 (CHD6), mRNA, RefSeq: NM_032221.3 n=1 Tax=Macaca fascicularis TaxID=9541 RepID=I7GMY3_MACFA|nr:unnamed protein product [Macaca fascicularis]
MPLSILTTNLHPHLTAALIKKRKLKMLLVTVCPRRTYTLLKRKLLPFFLGK